MQCIGLLILLKLKSDKYTVNIVVNIIFLPVDYVVHCTELYCKVTVTQDTYYSRLITVNYA